MKCFEKNPLISIVVPVYNVERYITDAVKDIQNQTYNNFELFLIVDCSTDKSGEICDDIAKQDDRITVIHLEENGGVSKARNVGLDNANGEYLMFLDSDDRFSPDMIEKCVASIQDFTVDADVVIYGLCELHYDKNGELIKEIPICPEKKCLKNVQEVRENIRYLEETSLYGYPWNKMYKTETLKKSGARFPRMKFNEDIIFNIEFFYSVSCCVILDITPYKYAKRVNNSTTSRLIPTYYEDIMVKIDKLHEQFDAFGILSEENELFIAQRYVRYVFSALERNMDKRVGMNRRERKQFLVDVMGSERYKKHREYMRDSGLAGIMARNLKNKGLRSCLVISRIIYIVKRLFPRIFSKIN